MVCFAIKTFVDSSSEVHHLDSYLFSPNIQTFVPWTLIDWRIGNEPATEPPALGESRRKQLLLLPTSTPPALHPTKEQPPPTFTAPGGLLFPVLATVASLAILASADLNSLAAGGLVLAIRAVIYGVQRLFAK